MFASVRYARVAGPTTSVLAFVEKAVPALAFRVFPSTTFLTTQSRMMAPRNIFSGLISVMLLSVARQ